MPNKRRFVALFVAVALPVMLLPFWTAPASAVPAIAEQFRDYYDLHQGMRVLGYPLSDLVEVNGFPAQYFEKGRIEDHRGEVQAPGGVADPNWAYMYGRLTVEVMERDPQGSIGGSGYTYSVIRGEAEAQKRVAPPAGFLGGTMAAAGGRFVPFDAHLRPAPGYIVPSYFWSYLNRTDLFPAGWLHDIGLPVTGAVTLKALKTNPARDVTIQAFERAILTYDPLNPADWRVEKGNIGADAVRTAGVRPPANTPSKIEIPAANARMMLPLHLLAYVGKPGEQVSAILTWQDGTKLSNRFTVLRNPEAGADGNGLVIGNVDWVNMLAPPEPKTQGAALEIRDASGKLLGERTQVTVVSPNDPDTREIKVYWTVSGTELVQPQMRRIIKTERPAAAALEELLWGPPPISQIGFGTALPRPADVLSYPGRESGWGPRVRLLGLTIENRVATADFSQEMRAYGGGSLRVKMIRDQITSTLRQFSSVGEVKIAIEGQSEGVLEP